jgi:hypothetical protein
MSNYEFKPKRLDKNIEKFPKKVKLQERKQKKSLRDLRGGRPQKDEDENTNGR